MKLKCLPLLLSSLLMTGCFNIVLCENCVIRRSQGEVHEWERRKIRAEERHLQHRLRRLEQRERGLLLRHEYFKHNKQHAMQHNVTWSENRNRKRLGGK